MEFLAERSYKIMPKKYLWWIGDKTGSIGGWDTLLGAKKAINQGLESSWLSEEKEWKPIKHEIEVCPTCGKPAEADIINGLGECLSCDHVRGNVQNDLVGFEPSGVAGR